MSLLRFGNWKYEQPIFREVFDDLIQFRSCTQKQQEMKRSYFLHQVSASGELGAQKHTRFFFIR